MSAAMPRYEIARACFSLNPLRISQPMRLPTGIPLDELAAEGRGEALPSDVALIRPLVGLALGQDLVIADVDNTEEPSRPEQRHSVEGFDSDSRSHFSSFR